jgi:hypothetical protein
MEDWKDIAGWPGYQVSNMGRVRSYYRDLKPILKKSTGYVAVTLHGAGKRKSQELIHRLVLEAFAGPCPEGMEGCHNNGNRADPRLENLRWDTRKGNFSDMQAHGTKPRGEKTYNAKLTEEQVRYIKASSENQPSLAKRFGVSQVMISKIRLGKAWAHVQ